MTNSAQFDRNTLATVKPGLDSTLGDIIAQMEQFFAAPTNNVSAVEKARTQMRSLVGVLRMVGLDGVAVFCEEVDVTLSDLASNPQQVSVLHRDAVRKGLFGVTHYLDALSNGASNATLRLFPEYQELQQLRGLEMSFALDLFFPNLDVKLPQVILSAVPHSDAMARLKMLRSQYQQGLLKWMRQEDAAGSLQQMQQALDAALRCAPQDTSRAFWWIAMGLIDCLKQDAMPPEVDARKMLSRIDQQLRSAADGNPGDTKQAICEMLYMIGRGEAQGELVDAIRETYVLDEYLPRPNALPPGETDQLLGVMRDELRVAEESWELCVQGDAASSEKFIKYIEQLAQKSKKLDRDVLQYLIKGILELSQNAASSEQAKPIAMDMAMTLLLLGSGIENYNRLGGGFQQQARILIERMQAAVKQQPEDDQRISELINLHQQMEQRGDVMGPLANEMLVNLQHVEQGLNTFFGDPLKRDGLIEILRLLGQIQGGLRISTLTEAEKLLSSVLERIRRFSRTTDAPKSAERYALADALSALENYMQHLTHGQAGDVWRLQDALAEMVKLDQAPAPVTPPAAKPEEAKPQPSAPVAKQPESVAVKPTLALEGEEAPLEFTPAEKPQPPQLAETAPAEEPKAAAPAAPVPEEMGTLAFTPSDKTVVMAATPAAAEEAEIEEESAGLTEEEQELLDIFLEEAKEVLATMRSNLATCQSQPGNHEVWVEIRRGFHTLKGSGRMVGLTDLGEVAWNIERAMNKWLQENKPASPGLLRMIDVAIVSFSGWVETLSQNGKAVIAGGELVAAAQQLENGEEPMMTGGAPGKTGEAPAEQPAIEELPTEMAVETAIPATEPAVEDRSGGLFSIASAEAKQNAEVLRKQLAELRSAVPPVVHYDFMRAAHTLAGVSRTLGFAAVVELASALEAWLQVRLDQPFTLNDSQLQVLDQSIEALDVMINSICEQQEPRPRDELVTQLRADRDNVGAPVQESAAMPETEILPAETGEAGQPVIELQMPELPSLEFGEETLQAETPVEQAEEQPQEKSFEEMLEEMDRMGMVPGMGEASPAIPGPEGMEPQESHEAIPLPEVPASTAEEPPQEKSFEEMLEEMDRMGVVPGMEESPASAVEEALASVPPPVSPVQETVPAVTLESVPQEMPIEPAIGKEVAAAGIAQVEVTVAKQVEPGEAEKPQIYDDLDDQLLPVFLEEAEDLSPKITEGMRAWRENPQDEDQGHLLKRLLHTMKGSSRMVGAMRIGEIAHEMENQVADAKLRQAPGFWEALEAEYDRIAALIEELRTGKPAPEVKPAPVPMRRATDQPIGVERRAERRGEALGNMLRVRSDIIDRMVNEAAEINVARSRMESELRVFKDGLQELTSSVMRLRHQLREIEIQAETQMQARVSLAKDHSEEFDPLEFDRFTRLQELTRFMNESVHDVQMIQQTMLRNLDESAAAMAAQGRLNRELQQGLMNVRMVSFNSISDRLYRIVRQTGKELNKRANLELQGTNVELDRSVLEKMIAPFEHLLRNSMVHGLEDEAQRVSSGKLPMGEIRLRVRQENNEIVFDFSDDGAGLNYDRLREKGIANGTFKPDEEVSEAQLAELIFTPGLSTAAEITEIAGRGVGMDVVRSEITTLGGRIEVSSKRGQGTTFSIHLPLTLAVTQVLMVRSGANLYAIPSTMVEQVRQVKPEEMLQLIDMRRIEWQGGMYPLYYLQHLLGELDAVPETQARNPVLLLRSGGQRVALRVDELLGNQETMVKNIGPQLSRMSGIAGATILGNGTVVLILNPALLAQRAGAGMTGKPASTPTMPKVAQKPKPVDFGKSAAAATQPLIMVVDDSLTVRKITSRMLTRAGYQVVTATDGVDALEKLEEFTPKVMLLDIEMPRMDGFALARELRRDPKTHDLPIIMITSRTADKHREYAMQLGVNTYMGKPYQEDDLLQNIADFVATHKEGT